MFDLALTDEQDQLVAAYRGLFERECDPEVVRQAEEDGGFSPALWSRIGELGGVDMAVPESAGGAGALLLDVSLVAELAGRFLAPVPLAEAVATTRFLAALRTDGASTLLAEVLAAGAPVTLTPRKVVGDELRWVPAGRVADVVVARRGDQVVAVRGDEPTALANLGALPVADRRVGPDAVVLAEGPAAVAAFDDAILEWRGLTGAMLVGAGLRVVEIGVAYTTERHAFGVPIASFQTIAHRLADARTALDGAQLLSRKAAWAADANEPRWRALSQMAFVMADEAAEKAVDEVLHFHGGYGFTLEYDIQLYFRRVKAWALQVGDRAKELERIADLLWGPVPGRAVA